MITLPIKNSSISYKVDPRIIIGVGLNYRDHIAEHDKLHVRGFTEAIPKEPVFFAKTPNVLTGPGDPIIIPRFLDACNFDDPRVDYEGELAFIIKNRCKNVPHEEALQHILGFTCMNDVTQRNLQRNDQAGWFRGKSLDTFGPIGPVIVTPADLPDPNKLALCTRLNGVEVQSSNTCHMIFTVETLLAHISTQITLQAGDIISTGTPAGVGAIVPGDVVEIEIEGIGTLRNSVIAEHIQQS